jgi:hypothetical protein
VIKVWAPPQDIPVPEFSPAESWDKYNERVKTFINRVRAWAEKTGSGDLAGKLVSFPVGDGYAQYVVWKPTHVIHLPVGDKWHFQYIERLKAADIRENVRQNEAIEKIFTKR